MDAPCEQHPMCGDIDSGYLDAVLIEVDMQQFAEPSELIRRLEGDSLADLDAQCARVFERRDAHIRAARLAHKRRRKLRQQQAARQRKLEAQRLQQPGCPATNQRLVKLTTRQAKLAPLEGGTRKAWLELPTRDTPFVCELTELLSGGAHDVLAAGSHRSHAHWAFGLYDSIDLALAQLAFVAGDFAEVHACIGRMSLRDKRAHKELELLWDHASYHLYPPQRIKVPAADDEKQQPQQQLQQVQVQGAFAHYSLELGAPSGVVTQGAAHSTTANPKKEPPMRLLRAHELNSVQKLRIRKGHPCPTLARTGHKRYSISLADTATLERLFEANASPSCEQKLAIGAQLCLDPEVVSNWFKNKRSRRRLANLGTCDAGRRHSVSSSVATSGYLTGSATSTPSSFGHQDTNCNYNHYDYNLEATKSHPWSPLGYDFWP